MALHRAHSQIPIISPSIVEPLVAEDDPTQFCYSTLVVDETGRLWMKTCGVAEQLYALQVLQFDGYDRWPINLVREEWKALRTGYLEGVSQKGFLYGFLNQYPGKSTLYTYQAENDIVHYTPMPEGIVGGIEEYEPGKFWVLEKTKTAFNIYDWDADSLQLYISIPNDSQYSVERKEFVRGANSNFIYLDSTFWILDQNLPIIAFHQSTRTIDRFDNTNFLSNSKQSSSLDMLHSDKVYLEVRDSVLYVTHPNIGSQFYKMNWKGEKQFFTPLSIIPENAQAKSIWKDEHDNLLLVFETIMAGQRETGAYLIDPANQVFDYSPMLAGIPEIRHITGKNFKQQAYIGTSTGAFSIQALTKSTILTYTGSDMHGLRHIRQIGQDEFLIRIDDGFVVLNKGVMSTLPEESCFENAPEFRGRKELLTDTQGMVWLKDEQHLYRYAPNADGSCLSFSFDFKINAATFLTEEQVALIEAEKNKLIIYDIKRQEIVPISETPIYFPGIIHYLMVGQNNVLWVATNEGLHKVKLSTGAISHYGKTGDFEDHRILVIHEDQKGRLWLGTANRGIHVFDPKEEKVVLVIDETDGLSNNIVVGILEDDDGDIWVATYNGLTIIKPTGKILTILKEKDGLSYHEFNRYAHFKTDDGRLIFGALNGLNIIKPQEIKQALQSSEETKIFLSRISYFDSSSGNIVNIRNYHPGKQKLTLSADKRFLSVSVGMSNYGLNAKNRYAYQLQGINEEWISTGSEHIIRLPNLPAGNYHLLIAGIDPSGNWSANTLDIPIHAKEYFYKQVWFYIALALPFLAFALLWVRRLSKEKETLEREVDKRTIQIRKDKELIEQQASELRQLDQMKSRFFANISHDFRTPLTLITGPAELIEQDEALPKVPRIKESLQSILRNGKKLLDLVDEMLDLAKVDSHQIKLHEKKVDLQDYCKSIFFAYQAAAVQKQIQYQFTYQLSPDISLKTDPRRLEKILNNLLSNAFKFTQNGGSVQMTVSSRTDRTLKTHEVSEHLLFMVSDTGRGIPLEDLPHVFDRYFQSKQEGLALSSGSGIGLSLSLELAKLLGGEITVESEFGKGSTFTLILPLNHERAEAMSSVVSEMVPIETTAFTPEEHPTSNSHMSKVLIIEDNLEVQAFLQSLLLAHYQVVSCNNGLEALNYLKALKNNDRLPVDLILSDINMPQMDGYELLANIKEDDRLQQIPVVMLTAKIREKSKLKALRMGVDDYLTKPFSPTELLLRIQNLLKNYKTRLAYQKELHPITPQFVSSPSADQTWLEDLEKTSLDALDKKIDLTIAYLSDKMAISERQLSRKIKLVTGLTIGKYIQEIKLQKARHLLENRITNSVAEASYLSGFKSPSYFTKVYHKYYGKNPSVHL